MKDGQAKAIFLKDYKVPDFLIDSVELKVELGEEVTYVTSQLSVRCNPEATARAKDLLLDGGVDLELQEIKLDGRDLGSNEYGREGETLTLFDVPDSFTLDTRLAIKPQENTRLEGLYKSGDMFCTQCEAQGFRNITFYLDRPDAMSAFKTTLIADRKKYPVLLSNGNDIDRGEMEDGKHWVTWQDPFRKPAYLFAMVGGDLQFIEDEFITMSGRKVTLRIFTEAKDIDKVDFAMKALKNSMTWDEKTYGREYDLDIFMIVAVDSFNMGAMENKGLNIFNTSCVLARPETTTDAGHQRVEAVVAHEYFHNWSGNRVTCRDWFQLSLKEGFTVFRDQQFSADMGSPTVCRVDNVAVLRNSQFPEDAGPMAHPIRPDSYIEINNFYTLTVYEKGAEVVRMIHTLLGEQRFRQGSDLYFERHDGQAVTTEDFVRAMEDANQMDLSQFRLWYSQAGTPVLKVDDSFDEKKGTYTLNVTQSCPPTPQQENKEPFHVPFALGLLDSEGKDLKLVTDDNNISSLVSDERQSTVVLNLTKAEQSFRFENIETKPVPSLLRGFSAPVKLEFDYSRDELMFLMTQDVDGFNRWEAGQRLAVQVIQDGVVAIQSNQPVQVDERLMEAYENILQQAVDHHSDGNIDKSMVAAMLMLPSETYMGELVDEIDVNAIHQAREIVKTSLAEKLNGLFLSVFKLNQSDDFYQPKAEDIAARAIKNVCLAYLLQPEDNEMISLCVNQFEQSDNMTDVSAALRCLVNSASTAAALPREKALTTFYNKWSDEALVIDQWFAIQAASPLPNTMTRVKALLDHKAFTLTNPNRLRSLVAVFAMQNLVNFHSGTGEGYEFLADHIIKLNSINPQIAARIMTPLTRWRRYDARRQEMIKGQLQRILDTENLSPDVFEIASKSC